MAIKRIVADLHADEPDTELYVDVLGLELAMDLGWISTFTAPGNPAAQLSVVSEEATAPVRPDVSIEIDDVDAVYAEVQRRGYEIVHPLTDEPWGVRRFFVRDASGHVLTILSHRGG